MTEKRFPPKTIQKTFCALAKKESASPVYTETAHRLVERLKDTNRTFKTVLEAGYGAGHVKAAYYAHFKAKNYTTIDMVAAYNADITGNVEGELPLKNNHFDLVLSDMMLPWINDVPQTLLKLGRLLKPDGLLLATTLGQQSFKELRTLEKPNAFAPMPDVQDVGAALQTLKFAMPVVDKDEITLTFSCFEKMLETIENIGFTTLLPPHLKDMKAAYQKNFLREDGLLPLTLEIIYLHGWRPHKNQQQPLKSGTARVHLGDIL